jgi:hypothetical protein
MFHVFVCEALAVGTLRQPDPFPKGTVVGLGVGGVQVLHRCTARYADGHSWRMMVMSLSMFAMMNQWCSRRMLVLTLKDLGEEVPAFGRICLND